MPNNITLFKQYTDLLDEVFQASAKTSVLDMDGSLVQAGASADEIVIQKYNLDGLADYKRNGGYVDGSVSVEPETVKFNYDRGRRFTVDAMDNAETAGIAFGKLSAEFIRRKVVPEMDAFRFASYAAADGIFSKDETLSSGEGVIGSLTAATNTMDEEEVDTESRVLFISPTLLTMAQNVDTSKSQRIFEHFSNVITVPHKRFYTAIDLLDGESENELAGGFKKAVGAQEINFLIVEKSSAIQFTKHTVSKIFSPEENQSSDGWLFVYRAYGLCDTYENRRAGIYLSAAPA